MNKLSDFRSGQRLARVSVLSPIAIDILMVRNGEGQSSHIFVFCVNFEWQISVILSSFTCSFELLLCETNYNINQFSKHFRHYNSIHL